MHKYMISCVIDQWFVGEINKKNLTILFKPFYMYSSRNKRDRYQKCKIYSYIQVMFYATNMTKYLINCDEFP